MRDTPKSETDLQKGEKKAAAQGALPPFHRAPPGQIENETPRLRSSGM